MVARPVLADPTPPSCGQTLGRWSELGLLGIPLVGCGIVASVAGWPRGWRGWLIALRPAAPAALLARHTQGVLFHYLDPGLPGMALCAGALLEWSRRGLRVLVAAALATYVLVSDDVPWCSTTSIGRALIRLSKPLKWNMLAADAARAVKPSAATVPIGGVPFSSGHAPFASASPRHRRSSTTAPTSHCWEQRKCIRCRASAHRPPARCRRW